MNKTELFLEKIKNGLDELTLVSSEDFDYLDVYEDYPETPNSIQVSGNVDDGWGMEDDVYIEIDYNKETEVVKFSYDSFDRTNRRRFEGSKSFPSVDEFVEFLTDNDKFFEFHSSIEN